METVAEKVKIRKHPFSWTDQSIETLKELKDKGFSDLRISGRIGGGCTEGQVRHALKCLRKYGRISKGRTNKNYSDGEDEFLIRTYCKEGWPTTEIAKAMGRSKNSIRARVDYLGIHRENVDLWIRNTRALRSRKGKETRRDGDAFVSQVRGLWTVRTERDRAKLYNGHRYEDADVPKHVPRCGRLG